VAPTCEEIAYAQSERAITVQVDQLDELRSRAGILLSASAIVASLLGAEALRRGLHVLDVVAILAFVAVLAACLRILLPQRDGWTFVVSAKVLLEDWADQARSTTDLQRFLAVKLEEYYDENDVRLESLYRSFQFAVGAIGVEVVAWVIEIGRG
jgi:hypothetical protein